MYTIAPEIVASAMRSGSILDSTSIPRIEFLRAADLTISNGIVADNAKINIPRSEVVDVKVQSSSVTADRSHPSHFDFSIQNVLKLFSFGVLTTASAVSVPWLIPFAVIVIIQEFKESVTSKLDEKAAIVLYAVAKQLPATEHSVESIRDFMRSAPEMDSITLNGEEIEAQLNGLTRIGVLEKTVDTFRVVETIRLKVK
jgi:hypothetical protein